MVEGGGATGSRLPFARAELVSCFVVGAPYLSARWGVQTRPEASVCAAGLLADGCQPPVLMLPVSPFFLVYSITTPCALHHVLVLTAIHHVFVMTAIRAAPRGLHCRVGLMRLHFCLPSCAGV